MKSYCMKCEKEVTVVDLKPETQDLGDKITAEVGRCDTCNTPVVLISKV